jgi:hypothetical protein
MGATQLFMFSSPTPTQEVLTPSLGTDEPAASKAGSGRPFHHQATMTSPTEVVLPFKVPEPPREPNPDPEPRPAEQSWGTFHNTLSLMADHGKYTIVRHYWAQAQEAFEYTRRKIASGAIKRNRSGRTPLLLDARRLAGYKPMAPTYEGCLWAQENGLWQAFETMEQA